MTETKTFSIFSPDGMAPDEGAIKQMENIMRDQRVASGALMADHHLGYSMPIGGVVAYDNAISPTGVGFDIGCGNKAVRTNLNITDFDFVDKNNLPASMLNATFKPYMRNIQKRVSFGLGRSSDERVEHALFDNEIWNEITVQFGRGLKDKARDQLGTVGSGNHYVDLLLDENDGQIWIANHFGSRGLGHTIASGFMAAAAGKDFTDRVAESEDAVVLDVGTGLGDFYVEAMRLAGEYAYAGRDYVAAQVLSLLGAESTFEVHNHHNFAWNENGLWVVRKGATPLTREPAFIGGSMGDISVIVRGTEGGKWSEVCPHCKGYDDPECTCDFTKVTDIGALHSAPHGAGRVMSRTKAAGKMRKFWICPNRNCQGVRERAEANKPASVGSRCPECGIVLRKIRMRDVESAAIDWSATRYSLEQQGITVLGAGADEAPGVYKPLADVLKAHDNIEILNVLRPLGVVMAGDDVRDPYKD